jgi:long-subunit acyl-CoA synthetase (AMP-forming)
MVGIRKEALDKLRRLARRKRVSQQGLLSALVLMASGEAEELGIIDLDWERMKALYPSQKLRQKHSWQAVVKSVKVLMEEESSAEKIAMRSRFTLAQVKRAMKEIDNE